MIYICVALFRAHSTMSLGSLHGVPGHPSAKAKKKGAFSFSGLKLSAAQRGENVQIHRKAPSKKKRVIDGKQTVFAFGDGKYMVHA